MELDPYIITVIVTNNTEAVREKLATLDDISDQLTAKGMDSYIRAMYAAQRYDDVAKTLRVPWIDQGHRSEKQELYKSLGGNRGLPLIDFVIQDQEKASKAAKTAQKPLVSKKIWIGALVLAAIIIIIYWMKTTK